MARSGVVCSVDDFGEEMSHIVEQRLEEIGAGMQKAVRKGGKTVIDSIGASSAFSDITGDYRSGWRYDVEGSDVEGYVATVYNAKKPGLAHLIEKGHGGPAPAGPHPHIAPAYEEGVRVFEDELRKAVT